MTCRVEPDDERIAALLAEDRIGNLGLAGELAVSEPGGIDLFLDDPDEPSGLLAVGWWVRIYARDPAALDRLRPAIPERHKFEDTDEIGFGGVASWIRDALAEDRQINWENACWLYHLEPGEHRPERARHEVGPLRPEHAELVNLEHADSVEYVRFRIESGPALAVYERGEPVSWALLHADGQMGLMHTLDHARGKGYASSLTAALSGEVLRSGKVPFLYTLRENAAAIRLVEKAGFRRWGDYRYFGAGPAPLTR